MNASNRSEAGNDNAEGPQKQSENFDPTLNDSAMDFSDIDWNDPFPGLDLQPSADGSDIDTEGIREAIASFGAETANGDNQSNSIEGLSQGSELLFDQEMSNASENQMQQAIPAGSQSQEPLAQQNSPSGLDRPGLALPKPQHANAVDASFAVGPGVSKEHTFPQLPIFELWIAAGGHHQVQIPNQPVHPPLPTSARSAPYSHTPAPASNNAAHSAPRNRKKQERPNIHACPWRCLDENGNIRRFNCAHNVAQHVRAKHTHEKPHKCHLCPDHEGFSRPGCLYRHQRQVHKMEVVITRKTRNRVHIDVPPENQDGDDGFTGPANVPYQTAPHSTMQYTANTNPPDGYGYPHHDTQMQGYTQAVPVQYPTHIAYPAQSSGIQFDNSSQASPDAAIQYYPQEQDNGRVPAAAGFTMAEQISQSIEQAIIREIREKQAKDVISIDPRLL